jgi:hypothetical protein
VSRTADIGAAERLGAIASNSALAALVWLSDAGTSGVVAILVSLAVCACLLARRAFERKVLSNPPVSDRLGRVLQQLRAGDTLRGLTSCPGPLPSQSRGRIAQRR